MKEIITKIAKKLRVSEKTVNYLLILILGFLVGIAVKTEAKNRITIGYNDYLAADMRHDFDLLSPDSQAPPQNAGEKENQETSPDPGANPGQ